MNPALGGISSGNMGRTWSRQGSGSERFELEGPWAEKGPALFQVVWLMEAEKALWPKSSCSSTHSRISLLVQQYAAWVGKNKHAGLVYIAFKKQIKHVFIRARPCFCQPSTLPG